MLTFALAGNPNTGKTTLFNALTGSTAHVGNWPGVTVEKREGEYNAPNLSPISLVDLPGIYSLSPYTPEERIARAFLLETPIDCIVNVVDATSLERNLYLTTQLLELGLPMVLALNMMDGVKEKGDSVNAARLQEILQIPVVEISARKGENLPYLMDEAVKASAKKRQAYSVLSQTPLNACIMLAQAELAKKGASFPLFEGIKLIEEDKLTREKYIAEWTNIEKIIRKSSAYPSGDIPCQIASERYAFAERQTAAVYTRKKQGKRPKSKPTADSIFTHKFWGVPIFLLLLFTVFHLTFGEDLFFLAKLIPSFSKWCQARQGAWENAVFPVGIASPGVLLSSVVRLLLGQAVSALCSGLSALGASEWIIGLLCDGVLGGALSVLAFLPQILLLFLLFSLMEDSGYTSRVAFMLDSVFCKFGISGRAFMPMIIGFGCSVPAVLSTRTLLGEKEKERLVRVLPFFFCGAKMPVLLAISGAISYALRLQIADIITYCTYLLGVLVALLCLLLERLGDSEEPSPLVMELPTYRSPKLSSLLARVWEKAKHFIYKAFSVIVLSTTVLWLLSAFSPWGYCLGQIERSFLAFIGKAVSPLFTPLGFGVQLGEHGWVFAVATLTGIIAKENILATLLSLAACLGMQGGEESSGIAEIVYLIQRTGISPEALFAFLVFNMLTLPCVSTLQTAKTELKKGRLLPTLLFWLGVSFGVAAAVYTVCVWVWSALLWLTALVLLFIVLIIKRKARLQRA